MATEHFETDRVGYLLNGLDYGSSMNATDRSQELVPTRVGYRVNVDKYAYPAPATRKEIQENDYNLNIPRYVDTFEEEEEIDLMAVRKERLVLQTELDGLEVEMAGYLEELGYGS